MKSWTLVTAGVPFGWNSLPALEYSPTSSFFFASTLITGWPSFMKDGQPVISVDAKKKELVGEYSNAGKEFQPKGTPAVTKVHDFIDPEMGKAIPYGVYDLGADEGWVSVGDDAD